MVQKVSYNPQSLDVVYITDSKYLLATAASIQSLKKSQTSTHITIYVVSVNLTSNQVNKLRSMSRAGFNVCPIESKEPEYKNETVKTYVSETALLKFNLPEILSKKDRVLYLDGDVLVNSPLDNFFKIEFEDKYAVVVRDIVAEMFRHHERLGLSKYFNSGVMLLNLQKMREQNLSYRLIKKKREDPGQFMDQDTFNSIFSEEVIYCDGRFNLMVPNFQLFGLSINTVNKFYGLNYANFDELEKDSVILHLTNKNKPWNSKGSYKSEEWLSLFKQTPFSDISLVLKEPPCDLANNLSAPSSFIQELIFNKVRFIRTRSCFSDECNLEWYGNSYQLKPKERKRIDELYDRLLKNIVISFTSYPIRFLALEEVVKSVFSQTQSFDRLIIWLDPDEVSKKEDGLPTRLLLFKKLGLTIKWKKNLKPHTKYFYAFSEFPDDLIVTIDDDIIYEKDTLKNLYLSYLRFPNCVITNRAHRILFDKKGKIKPYKDWEWDTKRFINEMRFDLLATGVLGVLYPSPGRIFNTCLIDEEEIRNYALEQDDIFLKFVELLSDVPVVRSSNNTRLNFVNGSQEVGLNYSNVVHNNGNDNFISTLQQRFFLQTNEEPCALRKILAEKHKIISEKEKKNHFSASLKIRSIDFLKDKLKSKVRNCLGKNFRVRWCKGDILRLASQFFIENKTSGFLDIFGKSVVIRETKFINFSDSTFPDFVSEITGLSIVEDWGRWSDENNAYPLKITMSDFLPNSFDMELKARSFYSLNCLEISIGQKTYPLVLETRDKTYNIHVELEGELAKEIIFHPFISYSPREVGKSVDSRKLGIGFISLKIIREKKRIFSD